MSKQNDTSREEQTQEIILGRSDLPTGWLHIDALDMEAQGIARRTDGKVVFGEGALPFEMVSANVPRKKNNWEAGVVTAIHHESSQRVKPGCPHFGLHAGACGGCKMQHLEASAQVAVKQRVLEDNLWHLGKVKPESMLRPMEGPSWGYRYRARMSVRYVHKKGEVLIGFHERKSRYVADIKTCRVLPPNISAMLMPLRELIFGMDARETIPQIELAQGDTVTALVLRHLEPLTPADQDRLRAFAQQHAVQWWLQIKGPDTVKLMDTDGPELSYDLPDFGVHMPFKPTDFTQVNPHINRVLVTRALRLLKPEAHERVIDWFCGVGNFTLPIATTAREVVGIEGAEILVARSRENLARNQSMRAAGQALAPTSFIARNLFEMTPAMLMDDGIADKWLIDPPREGAFELVKSLAELNESAELRGDWQFPKRIVYVSCNPATLARDAGVLVHRAGYRCLSAGVVNMCAHTADVESMAVFERND
jgi:23S rRNA (uracil1939-C5)-methyltransferase